MKTHTHLQTFRLWLEPDDSVPEFKRLRWELVGVSIQDVLLRGIHPWMGPDAHSTVPEAFVRRINEDGAKVAALAEFGYCNDVNAVYGNSWEKNSRFERVLKTLLENVCFVDGLSYTRLLEVAKDRLRAMWTHDTVKELAKAAFPGFADLRTFLKRKDKTLKLSGYEDLDKHDLSRVLTLDDFAERDSLLVYHGIPRLNFRNVSALGSITDETGRLKLVPEIRCVTVTEKTGAPDFSQHVWHVERKGTMLRFHPDIGDSHVNRQRAEEFAKQWRTDEGRLCFQTTMDKLAEMLDRKAVVPSFPSLNYTHESHGPTSGASVDSSSIRMFHIGRFVNHKSMGDVLKEVLRRHDLPMTGNKDQLLAKLANLAAKRYREKLSELDRHFTAHRYVRMQSSPLSAGEFPLLDGTGPLRNLLLTMYAIKHLRGNAILETAHENNTYTEEELALALLLGKVGLSGAFLRVA